MKKSPTCIFIGPPDTPTNIYLNDITTTAVTVSWTAGFDYGLDQTFVVQLSSNAMTWKNKTEVVKRKDASYQKFSEDLKSLHSSTLYFIRLYSYNTEGSSDFTTVFNFTTDADEGKIFITSVLFKLT